MMDRIRLMLAMIIYGTVGIFVRYIPLSSSSIAFSRAVIGVIFVLFILKITKKKIDKNAVKKNLIPLVLSGIGLGLNWILLFESFRYTSVAIGTLCNYMAPVFMVLASTVVLKEHLSWKKCICVGASVLGMVFVSGVIGGTIPSGNQLIGVLYGLGSATLYAIIVLINKRIENVDGYDKTVVQLISSAVAILPYILLTEDVSTIRLEPFGIFMLIFVGIVHTGIAYTLYFGSIKTLNAQTIAVYSYLDPVVAILLSVLLLKEPLGLYGLIGACLILGSTFVSDRLERE